MFTLANMKNNLTECTELHKCLANYLLPLNKGDQLLSTRELAELFDASLGSISQTVNNLEEIGAVTVIRRGHLGSFLENKSTAILWNIIENGPLVIALTLPTFPKCEGLATALHSLLNGAGIETYLTFIRGSLNRIKALRHGQCHAVVMSALTADELKTNKEEVIMTLPPQSFVMDHRVFYRSTREESSQPLRVGIDNDSFDVKYLTELEFSGHEVEFYQISFIQIDRHIEKSFKDAHLDAAISNLDHFDRLMSNEISSRPLSPQVLALIDDRNTSAAIMTKSGTSPTAIALKELLDPQEIIKIQQKVVDGKMVPRY
jgi:hypothetical protein